MLLSILYLCNTRASISGIHRTCVLPPPARLIATTNNTLYGGISVCRWISGESSAA